MTFEKVYRPKHQVLLLRCYPKYQKSGEIKPNSSELSYLLYYASTRRTKLHKVGAFLERKALEDIRHNRLGNVQVTFQILTALIEKCSRDLALLSPYLLTILSAALDSRDVSFIQETVPTFSAFCAHLNHTTFAAEASEATRMDRIIEHYTTFAKSDKDRSPQVISLRKAGLEAIKSLVSSEALSNFTDYLRVVMPPVLSHVVSDDPNRLRRLRSKEISTEQIEKEIAHRRRLSTSGRLSSEVRVPDPAAAGSVADSDRRADEELGVLALQTLKIIFRSDNRGLLRVATTVTLDYVLKRQSPAELLEQACQWSAVQDRFVILVTAMENLTSSPITEEDVPRQLFLSELISKLLRSDISFIGLSVMDVHVGLIQHILLMLQLGGKAVSPHPQQLGPAPNKPFTRVTAELSSMRLQLVKNLQQCIAALAGHIYYVDQVNDMVAALLSRLKPDSSVASAIENPSITITSIADGQVQERPHVDGFFSFDTARLIALHCVKNVILAGNARRRDSTNVREKVDISAWHGTQWLLRDPDQTVRRAFVDGLLTWLNYEVDSRGLRLDKGKGAFLKLLHLAVYEQAVSGGLPEILMLHLLLTRMVQKLGINSVRSGLPMMLRLQETSPLCAALTLAYLRNLSLTFEFETAMLGRQISDEISRRRAANAFPNALQLPPLPLGEIDIVEPCDGPFREIDDVEEIVNCISSGYLASITSPPSSPAASPFRRQKSAQFFERPGIPADVRVELMETWSRDAAFKAEEAERTRSESVSGSRSSRQPDREREGDVRGSNHSIARVSLASYSGPGKRYIGGLPVHAAVVKVDDLKRALSGRFAEPPVFDDDDSLLSTSELSEYPRDKRASALLAGPLLRDTPPPPAEDDDVPPVPALPEALLRKTSAAGSYAGSFAGSNRVPSGALYALGEQRSRGASAASSAAGSSVGHANGDRAAGSSLAPSARASAALVQGPA